MNRDGLARFHRRFEAVLHDGLNRILIQSRVEGLNHPWILRHSILIDYEGDAANTLNFLSTRLGGVLSFGRSVERSAPTSGKAGWDTGAIRSI